MTDNPGEKSKAPNWDDEHRLESLQELYEETRGRIQGNIDWYTRNAKAKKQFAQGIRVFALFLLGLGSVTPVIIEVFNMGISASIATLIIAAGTGLITLDRYMGYSTAWMRFISTEMLLKSQLEGFEYEWKLATLNWAGRTPTLTEAQSLVNRCSNLRSEITKMVQEETQLWIQEFQSNLKSLDENFKTWTQTNRAGAITLSVKHGDEYNGGWDLYIDDRHVGNYSSTVVAMNNILPGHRKIAVIVKDKDTEREICRQESIVVIGPGESVKEEISLPAVKPAVSPIAPPPSTEIMN